MEAKVTLLLEQLQKKDTKKDSHNSSMPPSSDLFSTKKNLRPVSTKPSGGQFGHKGVTLEMTPTPDKIIDLKSLFCNKCGQSLCQESYTLKAKRQVIELPPIKPIFEEYRQFSCQCPTCQHEQIAEFPFGVNAPIQYGTSVEAIISYFSVYQYIPFGRLKSLFSQVFSLPLSEGTVGNILERSAQKCQGFYQLIKTQIAQSDVVGSDETGAKVNGAKWWIWVWQNVLNTFIVASDNRGFKTIEDVWKNGLPNATIISDRWAAQLKIISKNHQICLAHLLRDLIFLEESEKHSFATEFKQLILDVFDLRKILVKNKQPCQTNSNQAILLEKRINDLLLITIDQEKYALTATFQVSMLKHRNFLLPCIYDINIPPDNNGSERAIRNIKVKQKVSGQFKTGQKAFCVIRSFYHSIIEN
ncbi:MAG: IS66 family transposase [Emticicia sp.]|nr:IS66 family transposase [Emticicia sp.]